MIHELLLSSHFIPSKNASRPASGMLICQQALAAVNGVDVQAAQGSPPSLSQPRFVLVLISLPPKRETILDALGGDPHDGISALID